MNHILETAKEDTAKATVLAMLCWQLNIAGEKQKAKEAGEKSLGLADKLHYNYAKAIALNNLATLDWQEGNLQKAMDEYVIAAKLNEEMGNKLEFGHNLNNIGNIHYVRAEYAEAIKYYKRALQPYEETGSTKWMANTYNNLSATSDILGNYPEALKYLFDGLKMLREKGDRDLMPIFYLNIGHIYLSLENYPEALKNYQTYLALAREVGHKEHVVGAYGAIGRLYEKQGDYNKALANYSVALKGQIELGDKGLIAGLYTSFGNVYLHQLKYAEALTNYRAAIKIFQETGMNENLADSYINMGDIFSRLAALEKNRAARNKKYNDAVQVLQKGLALANTTGAKGNIINGYRVLSEVYKEKQDFKSALQYHILYTKLKDSVLNNETTRKLEQLRTESEVEKTVEEEKVKSEEALAAQKADSKRKREMLLAGFGLFTIITFFIALLLVQRNQKKRAIEKAESGHKMAELELQSLRAQLNPHFMFNSLNAIQDLIVNENNEKSHLYLSRFSKLLRMLLDNASQPFVTVKQELQLLELYLSLENLRIPNLQYSIEKDPALDVDDRMIPNMMLQPYIENAIWHGLSNKKGERKLHLRIHEQGNYTEFEVEDNGIGRRKAAELKQQFNHGHHSRGMQLLSKRFELLSNEYGSTIQTTITDLEMNGHAAGTLVKIDVPISLSDQAKQLVHDTDHHS